jgi:RimJ/RimL family protein N-acetyltransferase
MIIVPRAQLYRLRGLSAAAHFGLVMDSMIAGHTTARAWADDPLDPQAALVWDLQHSAFLAGSVQDAQGCRRLFDEQIAAARPGLLKLHTTPADADRVFGDYRLQPRERVLYRQTTPARTPHPHRLPEGYRISSITERFDDLTRISNFDAVRAEIEACWPSVDHFRRSGFGYVAHDDGRIVCWCTAECVSDGVCGIGIETVADHQGRGFAALTARRFLQHCDQRGIRAHWDAWADNLASIAVAGRIGLTKIETYLVFVGVFDD